MDRSAAACAVAVFLATPVLARADSGEPRPEVRAAYDAFGEVVRLTRSFGEDASARLAVGGAAPVTLAEGEVAATLVAGHGRVLAAVATDDADAPFRVFVVDGVAKPARIAIDKPGKRTDVPFAVAATATPDGFAVFFQEIERDDPTAAHTYLATLDRDAQPTGVAEVAVPWSLAAAAWNGAGYHLALIYASGEGMRLSMVSLDAAGKPEQHPDWASAPGYIADVHLVARDGVIRAFYRGAGGNRLHERDVTTIGQWGGKPAKAKDHGALPESKAIAIDARGKPTKISERAGKTK